MNKVKSKYSIFGILILLYYALKFPNCEIYPIALLLGCFMVLFNLKKKFYFGYKILLVATFSISYFMLESYIGYSTRRSFMYGASLIVLYFLGENWGKIFGGGSLENCLKMTIKIIYVNCFIFIVLCMAYSIVVGHPILTGDRSILVFWNDQSLPATHFATITCIPLAMAFYGIFNNNGKWKIVDIIIAVSLVLINFVLSNRIILVLAPLFLLANFIITYKGKALEKKVGVVVSIVFIILLFLIIYGLNIFNVQEQLNRIPIFQRISELSRSGYKEPRIERQIYILKNFFKYTNGGGNFCEEIGEPHNVWLDIYDYSGWFPFVCFLIFTIVILKQCIFAYKKCEKNETYKMLIMFILSFVISFLSEPVMRSLESITILYFFGCGLLSQYIRFNKIKKANLNSTLTTFDIKPHYQYKLESRDGRKI